MYRQQQQHYSQAKERQCPIESARVKMSRFMKRLLKSKNFYIVLLFVTFLHFFFNYYLNESNGMDSVIECFATRKIYSKEFDQTDQLDKYVKLHRSIMESNDPDKKMVFSGDIKEGYGNRLYTFLSSILIAILTDSALVVNWDGIEKYIEPPIDIFYAKKNNLDCLKNSGIHKKAYEMHAAYGWNQNKDIQAIMSTNIPLGYNKYIYNSIDALFMEICANPIYFDKLLVYNLTSQSTINQARKIINTVSSSDSQKREYLFKIGFEVGGNLLNRIWTPNQVIAQIVDSFVQSQFKGYFVIGIQLRYHYLMDGELYSYKFISCALQIESDYLLSLNFTQKYPKGVKWFIASDNEAYLNKLVKLYPGKVLTSNGTISHIHNPDGYQRAIVDVELLSRCDEILMTGGSTFAFMGAMKSLRMPFNIDGQQLKLNPNHSNKLFKILYSIMNTIDEPPIEKCARTSMDRPPLRPDGISVF